MSFAPSSVIKQHRTSVAEQELNFGAPDYQSSFKPNWICLDVVRVDVMTPAVWAGTVEADVNTTGFGVPRFAWFRILKNSARNCSRMRSVNAVVLSADKSSS